MVSEVSAFMHLPHIRLAASRITQLTVWRYLRAKACFTGKASTGTGKASTGTGKASTSGTGSKLFHLPLLILLLSWACLHIDIPSLAEQKSNRPSLSSQRPALELYLKGKDIHSRDWAQALSVSRLFFSGIKNKSGSLAELLKPALRDLALAKGYHFPQKDTDPSDPQSDPYQLKVDLKRHQLLWLPPVEFIQTPSPRRLGEIRVDFLIATYLVGPSPERNETELSNRWIWQDSFQKKVSLNAFPGNEKESLEIMAYQTLKAYLQDLTEKLPPAFALQ